MNKLLILWIILVILFLRVISVAGQSDENAETVPDLPSYSNLDECFKDMTTCNEERFNYANQLQREICPKEFKQTCPTVPIPTVEVSNLKVTEHPIIDSKIVPLNDPRVDAAVASIVTLNNNLYNEVTNSAAELCDSATTYIRRLAQEKKKGVPVASPCIQYWEADVLISGRLKEFKKAVREELKAIMTTPASTKATPAPESKPAMVVQQENCGLTLEDLENFFTIPNCAKNPWICIPWAVLVLIAFGAMIAIIVICVNMDWSFGYNCSKRRGILRNPGSSRVRFATEDNPESGNGHGAPASASGTGRQD